ncbi:uncharacterized protein LOC127834719 [Dreissena polymorpha]|uniref:Uncharacterized protein n=1 Tax=Dreissena polymorpha TaxID=45954 RepID=A0A9D4JFR9_DREPO|nr:uncharacterized protein LOC127834719 [Dreissena polymorpha]XP_052216704.1 uncharacterized protein LOC127834719 [Dreissena polymorpha]KAH3808324.1 hypothetical protein DPMN_136677 [Dreissena polymorpha]
MTALRRMKDLMLFILASYHLCQVHCRISTEIIAIKRFLHGCPFAFPCMLPPCDNPVFGPGNCCGSCPESDTTPVATPYASQGESAVTINHLPLQNNAVRFRRVPYVRTLSNPKPVKRWTGIPTTTENPPTTTENPLFVSCLPGTKRCSPLVFTLPTEPPQTTTTPPTTTDCPYPCTFRGHHYCFPLPCMITCVDAVRPPGGCCYECPNGPNCDYQGTVIPEGQNVTVDGGVVVFCSRGGYRGSVTVYGVPGVLG